MFRPASPRLLLGLTSLCALLAPAAHAQGLPDARTGIALPNAQSGAVEDATALLVNPAGLAQVEGLEVNIGSFLRTDGHVGQTDADGTFALRLGDGLGFALGTGLTLPDGGVSRVRTSAGLGIGTSRTAAIGVAMHAITPVSGGGRTDVSWDLGTQLRPARWMAFGAGLEALGARTTTPASARLGVSLRPLDEMLTVGLDARLIPGSNDFASSHYGEVTVVPALTVRLDLGGLALTAGASMKNLGVVVPGPPALEVLGGIELNGEHLGVGAVGGADGILTNALGGSGGVRLRASTAQYPGLFPDGGRFLTIAITGDGVPVAEGGGFAELFADRPKSSAVLNALHSAAADPSVEGILVRVRGMSLGWGRLAELRAALQRFKDAGKKVVVHLDGGDDADVYLASVADKIFLTPAGGLDLNGLRAEMTYFGDTLEKIGVEAEAVSAGRYKSAPRTFTADEPSPEELEVENALLDGAFGALTEGIAQGRGLTVDQVKAAIDKGGLIAKDAVDLKLVDGLCYEDELEKRVEEVVGHPVRLEERFMDREARNVRWDPAPRIALIPVTGEIVGGHGGGGLFGSNGIGADDLIQALSDAAEDDGIKAIVLRVDSPGGDALASDLIWHAVMKAREKKPVVASMGDVAASGGYYVAAAAQTIFAEPNTITGSIGVFGLMFNAERLADKIGVRSFSVERGALPGPSILRGLSDAERAALQTGVNATYERFLDAVTQGRGGVSGLDKDALRGLAEGRVWTGAQAHERKLVDALGGLGEALKDARKRAGIAEGEDVGLDVITGRDGDLMHLGGLARALAPASPTAGLEQAVRLLLGDPNAMAFALSHEGQPLAIAPVSIRVR